MIKKHYDRLGLGKGATKEEIKKAYRRKAKLFHPDRNDHPQAEQRFIDLNLSYEILMDYKEGGIPTYTTTTNSVNPNAYKQTTFYQNTNFTIAEMEAAWARQRARERKEYEEFLKLPWNHPTKIHDFFHNYAIAFALGFVILIFIGFSITLISFGLTHDEDKEAYIFTGVALIIMSAMITFGIIKTIRSL